MHCDKTIRVLLLGGTGAIGVYLAPILAERGFEVWVTSRSERHYDGSLIHYIRGNSKDDGFLDEVLENQFDVIIDFMVYHTDEFQARIDKLLASTRQYIFLSSYRVYGESPDSLIDEATPRLLDTVTDEKYLSTDEYGLTKARQENILADSDCSNWTVVRPAITYSKGRFQLGTMEAEEFLHRALKRKPIIFPREMLSKYTTMTWAGDVANMIAALVLNEDAYSEVFTVSTAESHTWEDVLGIYRGILGMRVKLVSLDEYIKIFGRPYQVKYDRMLDRRIDNAKILRVAGMRQEDLMPLAEGLRMELAEFSVKPNFKKPDPAKDKAVDSLTRTTLQKCLALTGRVKPRTRVRQAKAFLRSRMGYDGAIVTLCGYYNYGSVIQRFALQQFLLGESRRFKLLDLEFMHPLSKRTGDRSQLRKFAEQHYDQEPFNPYTSRFYKSYIVGSDQVWRAYFKQYSKYGIFYLNFVKSKKAKRIAYAASFGEDTLTAAAVDGEKQKRIRPLLAKFDAISVRETSGKKLVRWLGGKAEQVLDPTLLMGKEFYSSIINESSSANAHTESIFTYILDDSEKKREAISRIAAFYQSSSDGVFPNDGTPLPPMERWLKGFRDADFVITDSFHGMVFSIINRTNFVVFVNEARGAARMSDLLGELGLEDRIVSDVEHFDPASLTPIDWGRVSRALDPMIASSKKWLIEAIR